MAAMAQGKGGLSQGKGGGATNSSAAGGTLPTHAGGKPVVQGPGGTPGGYKAGMPAPSGNPGGSGGLAALFMGNQGYGGGRAGGTLPTITQPTRESMGLPDITKMLSPRAPAQQPAAPASRAPTDQEIQQRISQLQLSTPMYSQNGGVNAMDANSGGKAQRFADYYLRLKHQNPAVAAQALERSPYKSIFAPVQGTMPQQPPQRSQASLMADEINRLAAGRR